MGERGWLREVRPQLPTRPHPSAVYHEVSQRLRHKHMTYLWPIAEILSLLPTVRVQGNGLVPLRRALSIFRNSLFIFRNSVTSFSNAFIVFSYCRAPRCQSMAHPPSPPKESPPSYQPFALRGNPQTGIITSPFFRLLLVSSPFRLLLVSSPFRLLLFSSPSRLRSPSPCLRLPACASRTLPLQMFLSKVAVYSTGMHAIFHR